MTTHELVNATHSISFFDSSLSGSHSCSLKNARQEWGWSLTDLAREIERIRAKKNLPISSLENIRRQIIYCEKNNYAGPLWRELFSAALRKNPEELFGVGVLTDLPFSDLSATPIVPELLHAFHTKLDSLVLLEHMFGATSVRAPLENDLSFLKSCFPTVAPALRQDFVLLIARVGELLGWVLQELGDIEQADQVTSSAYNYYMYSTVDHHAKILMRRSNILLGSDPALASHVIEEAKRVISKADDFPRLQAAVYLQQALVHFRMHDLDDFYFSLSQAREYIGLNAVHPQPTSYMSEAYIASEVSGLYLSVEKYKDAIALLMEFKDVWPPGQQRDESIFILRLLLAMLGVGEFQGAVAIIERCVQLYKVAPSFRGRFLANKIVQFLSLNCSPDLMKYKRVLEGALKPII